MNEMYKIYSPFKGMIERKNNNFDVEHVEHLQMFVLRGWIRIRSVSGRIWNPQPIYTDDQEWNHGGVIGNLTDS